MCGKRPHLSSCTTLVFFWVGTWAKMTRMTSLWQGLGVIFSDKAPPEQDSSWSKCVKLAAFPFNKDAGPGTFLTSLLCVSAKYIQLFPVCFQQASACSSVFFVCSVLATFTVMVAWTEDPVLAQASSPFSGYSCSPQLNSCRLGITIIPVPLPLPPTPSFSHHSCCLIFFLPFSSCFLLCHKCLSSALMSLSAPSSLPHSCRHTLHRTLQPISQNQTSLTNAAINNRAMPEIVLLMGVKDDLSKWSRV